ncbi:MAG: lysophospholipase [Myxococcales bacterium]|nr:lysophospholipase [Myxococcales bacterium]
MTLPIEFQHTHSSDNTRIYVERINAEGPPKASVVVTPGFGEHIGRYHHVLKALSAAGYRVWGYDPRGHGQSGGRRSFIRSFSEYFDDLSAVLKLTKGASGKNSIPVVLLGHSQGGLIVGSYCMTQGNELAAAVLSAPAMRFAVEASGIKKLVGKAMSSVWPTLALPANIPAADLSHDPAVVARYESDPLVNKNVTARWYTEALAAQQKLLKGAQRVYVPILVLQGESDRVTDPVAARQLFERLGSEDKQFVGYKGLYHEILNEIERETVISDIIAWLDVRFAQK